LSSFFVELGPLWFTAFLPGYEELNPEATTQEEGEIKDSLSWSRSHHVYLIHFVGGQPDYEILLLMD